MKRKKSFKKYADEPYAVYDPGQLVRDEIDYYKELWESGKKDEVMERFDIPEEMKNSDFDDIEYIIEDFIYNDDIIFDAEWDYFKERFQELIDKYQPEYGIWLIEGLRDNHTTMLKTVDEFLEKVDDAFRGIQTAYVYDIGDGIKVVINYSSLWLYPLEPEYKVGEKVKVVEGDEVLYEGVIDEIDIDDTGGYSEPIYVYAVEYYDENGKADYYWAVAEELERA